MPVSVSDIRSLLDSDYDHPVLYRDENGDIDVWVDAYVPHHQIIARRHDIEDVLQPLGAEPPTNDEIAQFLAEEMNARGFPA